MAEIHVEAKKKSTPSWIWILIGVVVVGVIVFFLLRNKRADQSNGNTSKPNPTSVIQAAVPGGGYLT
jgi:hypothetical protein